MEVDKEMYKRYEKNYRRKFNMSTEEFIESSLIAQMVDK